MGRQCFQKFVSVILFTGVGSPPWTEAPSFPVTLQTETPQLTSSGSHQRGLYASYWNAYLLMLQFIVDAGCCSCACSLLLQIVAAASIVFVVVAGGRGAGRCVTAVGNSVDVAVNAGAGSQSSPGVAIDNGAFVNKSFDFS